MCAILLLPTVRVTYGYAQKWLLNNPLFDVQGLEGLATANWSVTAHAAIGIDWLREVPALHDNICCDMLPGDGVIKDWDKQCHR